MTHRDAPRVGRTTWRLLARVLAPAVLLAAVAPGTATPAAARTAPGSSSEEPRGEPPAPPRDWSAPDVKPTTSGSRAGAKSEQVENLAPSLQDDAGRSTIGRARAAGAGDTSGTIRVTVEATDASTGRRAVESVGGVNAVTGGDLVEADVRPDRLEDLASAEGVELVREPRVPTMLVESEGVAATGSDLWQTAGLTGAGIDAAVIDAGFEGYAALEGTELPDPVTTDFSRCGNPANTNHGTAVAEIVHDMAPDAALRLVCIDTDTEIINALDTLPAAVDVVNISLGWTLLDRGDGSGPISAAVDRARDRGVLVVVAAGNYGAGSDGLGFHRNQSASGDTPGGGFEDLINLPGGDDALGFLLAPGGTAVVSLQWDAWPTTAQDLDLYLVNETQILAGSEGVQNGNDPPVEQAILTNPSGSEQVFWVLVNRWAGTATPRMDVFFDGDVLAIEAPTASSIGDPAIAHGALAVGAHCYADPEVEWFSSAGPTIDGRIKPDLIAPDGTSGSDETADGCFSSGFLGTSAAAPHVVGAAAQLLDANPDLDVAELHRLLQRKAQDGGAAGLDNLYGAGRLHLGTVGDAYLPAPQSFTGMEPTRLMDSRPGSQAFPGEAGNRITPIPAGGILPVRVRGGDTGVPPDAVAVALNVTAVSPTAAGWLTVFPNGTPPTASNINFAANQTLAVHVTATVGSSDSVRVFNALGSTHLVVDVAGWYGPTGDLGPSTDRFTPLASPARAMDTRGGVPLGYAEVATVDRTAPAGPGQTVDVQLAGLGGVPGDATAVMLNLTGIAPTATTFITAFPGGSNLPTASNLNMRPNQTVANLVVVPVGLDGVVRFLNNAGNTHMAIDVVGYYRSGTGAGYVALDPPTRGLDTRTGTGLRRGALGGNSTFNLKVARRNGVPADAAAVMLSVAAVSPTSSGWLTVYPGGTTRPNASNVNFPKGGTIANAVLSRFGATGTVALYNSSGSTHVISDLAGYFIDPANVQLPPP